MGDDPGARREPAHARPGPQHDAGQVGAEHVERLVVVGRLGHVAGVPGEEPERGFGLEQRAPHGVVVDAAGHHGHQHLTRPRLRRGHLPQVQRLGRAALLRCDADEHLGLVGQHTDTPVVVRDRHVREVIRSGVVRRDHLEQLLHRSLPGAGSDTIRARTTGGATPS